MCIYNNVCRQIYLYGLNIWVMRINEVCIGTKRNDFSDQSTASCSLEKNISIDHQPLEVCDPPTPRLLRKHSEP